MCICCKPCINLTEQTKYPLINWQINIENITQTNLTVNTCYLRNQHDMKHSHKNNTNHNSPQWYRPRVLSTTHCVSLIRGRWRWSFCCFFYFPVELPRYCGKVHPLLVSQRWHWSTVCPQKSEIAWGWWAHGTLRSWPHGLGLQKAYGKTYSSWTHRHGYLIPPHHVQACSWLCPYYRAPTDCLFGLSLDKDQRNGKELEDRANRQRVS